MSTISQFYSEGKLVEEMSCVFAEEDTAVTFYALLENARNFNRKNLDDRTVILTDIVFFKNELENMRIKTEAALRKQDSVAYLNAFNSIKQQGLKYTEELIKATREYFDLENTNPKYASLLKQNRCCTKWVSILTDLYFVLNSTNKILSNNV